MSKQKNTPPKGVLIAFGTIVVMILIYFVLASIFPEIFENLSEGQ